MFLNFDSFYHVTKEIAKLKKATCYVAKRAMLLEICAIKFS